MEFCSVCIKLRRGAKIWRHFAQNTYCRLREQIQQHYNVGGNLLKTVLPRPGANVNRFPQVGNLS